MGGIAGMVILTLAPIFMAFLDDGPNYVKVAAFLHPAYAIVATTADARFFGVFAEKWSWLTSFLSSMAFSLVLLGFASRRLTTLSRRVPRPPLIRRMFEGLDRYFSNHRLGISIWRSKSTVWDWNPLLWKELRYRMTGRLHYVIRIFVGILVVFAVLFFFMGENVLRSEFHLTGYTLLTVLMVLASMGAGATSFTREKELRQWDMLRTIPVHPESMVRAKLGGGLASLVPFAGLYALGGLGIIAMSSIRQGHRDDGVAWTLIVSTACFCTFLVSLGLYLSARFDTTKKALGWTLAAAVFILILIPILVSLADLSRDEDRFILAWTNPFYHVSALSMYGWERRDGNYIGGVFGHALIYLSLSAILVRRCVARIRMATV
jgi:ABC-type transport system involved in multi-copper enzyme maturation permease subunit